MVSKIGIPFGAKGSESDGWEYTIPENMEAEIKDGKIIVRKKESEDERIRKEIIKIVEEYYISCNSQSANDRKQKLIAYLEKQREPMVDSKGLYYYDGEKIIYCGFYSTEENPYDFAMNQQEGQKPAEYEEDSNDETKQGSLSADITESIRTGRIGTLKNLLSYLKYERKTTQEEIKLSFIPCIENLLEEIKQKPAEWSKEEHINYTSDAPLGFDNDMNPIYPPILQLAIGPSKNPPINHWKPSKEQLTALESTMYDYKDVPWYNNLSSLYNDLEKL